MSKDIVMVQSRRPALVYLAALWSLARTLSYISAIIGWYLLNRLFTQNVAGFIGAWMLGWIIPIILFLGLSLGIFIGKTWGRIGFIALSLLIFVWNLLRDPPIVGIFPAVYSLIALLFASWLFNQPSVLSFFEAEDYRPSWLNVKIFHIQLDLFIALLLLAIMIALEVITIIPGLPSLLPYRRF